MLDVSSLKIDLKAVEQEFINAVVNQAEEKEVPITDISLVMFPMLKKGKFGRKDTFVTRVKVMSMTNKFQLEVVRMRKLTMFDMTGHISKAIMEIFKAEVEEHNYLLGMYDPIHNDHQTKDPNFNRIRSYPSRIGLDKLECYIQVGTNENLIMTFVYDRKPLRPYSIREQFKEVDNMKVGDAIDPADLNQIEGIVKNTQNE